MPHTRYRQFANLVCFATRSEHSKMLNEMRLKVLQAKEAAIQEIVADTKARLRDVPNSQGTYKKLLTELLVQVRPRVCFAGEGFVM
jgi:vacuolar-type H+-ATPase subunit E/Vma4